jgi:hypothetical protein
MMLEDLIGTTLAESEKEKKKEREERDTEQ